MDEEVTAIVIDNGSGTIKSGFAGDTMPVSILQSIVGKPKVKVNQFQASQEKDVYIGMEAYQKREELSLERSIEHGLVVNWDDIEKIWHHILYNDLRVEPAEHPVLMTEATLTPKLNREKMTQIMFETFNVPCLYGNIQAVFSIYDIGRTTGVVLDSGYDISHAIPIYEGFAIPDYIARMPLAGIHLTDYMKEMLKEKGLACNSLDDLEIVNHIKETKTCVASDFINKVIQSEEET